MGAGKGQGRGSLWQGFDFFFLFLHFSPPFMDLDTGVVACKGRQLIGLRLFFCCTYFGERSSEVSRNQGSGILFIIHLHLNGS